MSETSEDGAVVVAPRGFRAAADRLVLLGAAALGLLTLTGFLGRAWWVFELTCHFRVQYCVLLILSGLWLLTLRRKWPAVVAASLALVNLAVIVPLYFGGGGEAIDASRRRLLLLNVHTSNDDYAAVAELIRDSDADFVGLLEVNDAWMNGLADALHAYPHREVLTRRDNFGVGLFSRTPFDAVEVVELRDLPSVVARVHIVGRPLTLVLTHAPPPAGGAGAKARNEHLAALGASRNGLGESLVVMGDSNVTSWSPYFSDLLDAAKVIDARQGFGVQATWGPPLFWIPVDHVLHSASLVTLAHEIGPDVGSDHSPVLVELGWRR